MKIIIETVPHSQHPYSTSGDWRRDADGALRINVSQELGERYASLVALHELVEVMLCESRGISCESVDTFDIEFEKQRARSLTVSNAEPGDSKDAPYADEHCFATGIERMMAAALHVKWEDYETAVNSLP